MTPAQLIALVIFLGAAMIAGGWVLEDEGYVSALLLQVGSTLSLIAPLIYVERMINRQLGEVRDELRDLRRRAEAVAAPYERLRAEEQSGRERTTKMEAQVAQARDDARAGGHDRADTAALFWSGSDGERIYALGLMQGEPLLADVDVVLDGIVRSRSAFEQYQALSVAQRTWDALRDEDRQRVLDAIDAQMQTSGYIQPGIDRYGIARAIKIKASMS